MSKIYNSYAKEKQIRHNKPSIYRQQSNRATQFTKTVDRLLEDIFLEGEMKKKYGLKNKWHRVIKLIECDGFFTKFGMELKEMLGELHSASKALGIRTNAKKTRVMTIRNRKAVPMVAEGKTLDCVLEYVYLGQVISFNRTPGIEITRQIRLA
jgi:hypothetical protein